MLSALVEFHVWKEVQDRERGGGGKKVRKKETRTNGSPFFLLQSFFFAARLIRGVKNGTVFLQEVALSRKEWGKKSWTYPRSSAITTLVI